MHIVSIPQLFHSNILIKGYETWIRRRRIFDHLAELELSQWIEPEVVTALQLSALRRLLSHAFQRSPYYREKWIEFGLNPSLHLQSLADFQSWPLINRDEINSHRMRMRVIDPAIKLIAKATGGASGVPMRFDIDTGSNDRRTAAYYRGYSWAGAMPGSKQLFLWGVPIARNSPWAKAKEFLYNFRHRRMLINSFSLSDQNVPDILARLRRYRPDYIVAYVNPLDNLARMLDERGLVPPSPRSIIVGAEKLYTHQRERIERVFRSPVYETYGSREFMLIGAECEKHTGFHLTAENLIVEILDDTGAPAAVGEEGRVVVTDLYNYGMPFIRYENGDRAIAGFGRCSCGRGLPILSRVTGRRTDILTTPSGNYIPGEFFPHLFKDFPSIRAFQVVQVAPARVRIKVVLSHALSEESNIRLRSSIDGIFGPEMDWGFDYVDEIPLSQLGKLQVVVNACNVSGPHFS